MSDSSSSGPAAATYRPIGPAELVVELGDRILARHTAGGGWGSLRVGIDGAPASGGDALAGELTEYLQRHSVPTRFVRGEDFLRDASVRLEYGHEDLESYARSWLDAASVRREVLEPLDPHRPAAPVSVLSSLRDPRTNRATRARPEAAAPDSVVLFSGALLLNYDLPWEMLIHLSLSEAALRRRTPAELAWTIPAFVEYDRDQRPTERADVTVRWEDPRRPAIK